MIVTVPIEDGYLYKLKEDVIGVGTYTDEMLMLLEPDNTTTSHSNGMIALSYLRGKYTPKYYLAPCKPRVVVIKEDKLSKFKNHLKLKGVHPIAQNI